MIIVIPVFPAPPWLNLCSNVVWSDLVIFIDFQNQNVLSIRFR